MEETILTFLSRYISGPYSGTLIHTVIAAGIAIVALISYFVARLVENTCMLFIMRSRTTWDDDLLNTKFLRALSQLVPAIVVAWLMPKFFNATDNMVSWVSILTKCYILWTVVFIFYVFIGNLFSALAKRRRLKVYAIKGIFQMVRLIVVGIGVILTVSILAGKSPAAILTALGASAAILMLVFKDTILGLVASVQLTANNMLHRGDWIVVDKHGANGEVIDVSLTTVKVRNWDNSVTTVPPYSLISESFRNYQPMRQSGGRRVERSIYIDVNTVRFCNNAELSALRERGWIADNMTDDADMVNLRLLRHYLEEYLSNHQQVNASMLLMVRQMEPTPSGLPLQLYFFIKSTEWKTFERIQSDIFDHVYAVINEFGLKIFQTPAGTDISHRLSQ